MPAVAAPLPLAFLQAVRLKPNPSNRNASIPTLEIRLMACSRLAARAIHAPFVFWLVFGDVKSLPTVHKPVDNLWTNFQTGGRIADGVLIMSPCGRVNGLRANHHISAGEIPIDANQASNFIKLSVDTKNPAG
jgi:hypothetical protein